MKIFLSSHGKLASGIKNSIEILIGNSDKLTVFDAFIDENNLQDELEKFIDKLDENEQALFLTDLFGGSVNQLISRYIDNEKYFLIAGVNLSLVLEAMLIEENIDKKILDDLLENGRKAMCIVDLNQVEIKQEDDFFE